MQGGSDFWCFSGLSSSWRHWRFSRAVCGCAECLWPHSSFFLLCLAPCPVYSLLCGKWMSLPSLKCWCVARFPSSGLARSEPRRCRTQLCATLRDLLLPALLGSAEPAELPQPTHRGGFWRHPQGGEAQVQLCWLKRGWRWIIAAGHKLRFQPGTACVRWGRCRQRLEWGASASLLWPASGHEDVGAVQGHPLMCQAVQALLDAQDHNQRDSEVLDTLFWVLCADWSELSAFVAEQGLTWRVLNWHQSCWSDWWAIKCLSLLHI